MILDIVTNKKELSKVCMQAIDVDTAKIVGDDLLDTANSIYDSCAGLAAPQIGHSSRIVVVKLDDGFELMINPQYITKSGKRQNGKEGCLSRPSTIENNVSVKRYYRIKIKYVDKDFKIVVKKFKGFQARVIQHEIDHLNGILI